MLAEMATAILLIVFRPAEIPAYGAWNGLSLLALVWLSTVLLQVPRHRAQGSGFDPAAWRVLVLTNGLRTAAWSLRGLLVLWMLARVMV
jgi:hypothetical protein